MAMVFKLTTDEVLQVCRDCQHFSQLPNTMICNYTLPPRELKIVRKCVKWDKHYGGTCLYRPQ